jgi:hypothetical protein
MRKIKLYFKLFWFSIVLAIISVGCWLYVPESIASFKAGLIASILGVGFSISVALGFGEIANHKRLKRTFGLLKLSAIPYLKNQAENMSETMNQYNDICTIEEAQVFAILVSNFDIISVSFDKSWLQLVYSQDFVSAIKTDDQFAKISSAIEEVLIFTSSLASQAVNAKKLLMSDAQKFSPAAQEVYLREIRKIRDSLKDSTNWLDKQTEKLDEEVTRFLHDNGAKYEPPMK